VTSTVQRRPLIPSPTRGRTLIVTPGVGVCSDVRAVGHDYPTSPASLVAYQSSHGSIGCAAV
jgi:hypothetical protein